MKIYFPFLILIVGTCFSCAEQNNSFDIPEKQSYLIAYNVAMNQEGDDYDIWTVNPKTRQKKNITNHTDVAWTYLAHDETIYFLSDRDTCNRCFYLYKMDESGQNVRKITNFQLSDSWMGVRNAGKELIVNPAGSVDSAFYHIDIEGNILNRINTGLTFASDPSFSPDGKQIAFRGAHKRSKREEGFREAIYVMNVDGTDMLKVTSYPETDTSAPWYAYKAGPPKWHPTDGFITYQSLQNGKYSLYAVQPDGSKQWKLTENPQEEGWHSWSPDGQWLGIEIFNPEQTQFDIGLMNWRTKELSILTDTGYQYQQAPVFVTEDRSK